MKALIQRVKHASVTADGATAGEIGHGLLVLLGVTETDTEQEVSILTEKLLKLRIFADSDDKTNCSIQDVDGELLVVSQFTLCADCRKGTRPSFSHAAKPDEAERLYALFLAQCRAVLPKVASGVFGAHMEISLCNDGPFTVMLDTKELTAPRSAGPAAVSLRR